MGDLSKNFSTSEFVCHHCEEVRVSPTLINALQLLRDQVGVPIDVVSGYRCPVHNHAVKGTALSQHLLGTAADIVIQGMPVAKMYTAAAQISLFSRGGIGIYPDRGFIHVDVRPIRARWGQLNGQYVSLAEAMQAA
jgi:uncharacterized protein YcbK (DUF882 family)